jgi:hypothetical protein
MELDLLVDDIVDELALDHELGIEILEPPDFFRGNDRVCFHVRGDIFKIILAGTPVPDCVPGEGPGINFVKKRIEIRHVKVSAGVTIYICVIRILIIENNIQYSSHPVHAIHVSKIHIPIVNQSVH